MRKVAWPTREQATKLTTVVIVISIAMGLFLGGADALFSALMTRLLQ
jgi:preprotein translocase SecE subunit